MNPILIIIFFLLTIFILFITFIFIIKYKIEKLEIKINNLFKERNNLIPATFEISKKYLVKHKSIFNEAIKLRKIIFWENNYGWTFTKTIKTQELLHKEINFIFKVCNKHPKLLSEWNFIYLRELILYKSFYLWKKIQLYKQVIDKFNFIIKIKNLKIILLLISINYKDSI